MRKYINFIKISLVLIVVGITGCYEQEIAPIVEPGGLGYTTAIFATQFAGNEVTEGDVITYEITLSRPIEYDLAITVDYDGDMSDIEYTDAIIPAYTTTGTFSISFIYDNIPEEDKEIKLEIGVLDVGHRYILTNTQNPNLNLTLKNKNDADGLTVAVLWPDDHDDWDCYMIDEAGAGWALDTRYDWVLYSGATGADPEIMILKEYYDQPVFDGTYFVDFDPYDVSNAVTDFKISIGHPDQTVEFFEFTFDKAKTDGYPVTWGYSAVKIVKAGDKYTCSLSPEFE